MIAAIRKFSQRVSASLRCRLIQRERAAPPQAIIGATSVASQILLQHEYRRMFRKKTPLPAFQDVGFKVWSQTDEDGILLFVFSIIGCQSKRCVEICAGAGLECNTANLILNHGWDGLLVDGNEALVKKGRSYYESARETYAYPPRFICSWITKENVNDLLVANGFSGEIDLLSLDLDGNDYWIWEAITVISPRVVILEYNDILGPDVSWTVPYDPAFRASAHSTSNGLPNYCGASLAAFVKLGKKKGYRFVGTNRLQFNAIFIRNGIADEAFPECDFRQCFTHGKVLWGMRERFPLIRECNWVNV